MRTIDFAKNFLQKCLYNPISSGEQFFQRSCKRTSFLIGLTQLSQKQKMCIKRKWSSNILLYKSLHDLSSSDEQFFSEINLSLCCFIPLENKKFLSLLQLCNGAFPTSKSKTMFRHHFLKLTLSFPFTICMYKSLAAFQKPICRCIKHQTDRILQNTIAPFPERKAISLLTLSNILIWRNVCTALNGAGSQHCNKRVPFMFITI